MTLVERLRAEETFTSQPQLLLIREAADELERVQQRVEVLEGENAKLTHALDVLGDEYGAKLDKALADLRKDRAVLGEGR